MQHPKLKVLAEVGAVREAEVSDQTEPAGWMRITYATCRGERVETLERQRGGVWVFATLDAVARCLAGRGLSRFQGAQVSRALEKHAGL